MTSSSVWVTLILLILVALVGYAGLSVRRARREHRARSDERAAALLAALHGARNANTARAPSPAGSAKVNLAATAPLSVVSPTLIRRPRLLSDTQRLLYLVLRSAVPDHIVMANIRIADLVDVPQGALERDLRLQALSRQRADCIVCSNDLVPLAALIVFDAGAPNLPDERIMTDALRELGVKFLRFRGDGLPRPAEMRALILG